MFSSTSYAEWTIVSEDTSGNEFYLDYNRIRKVDGHVYYWYLSNFEKLVKGFVWSASNYAQGDCKLLRFKRVSTTIFKEPLAKEFIKSLPQKNQDWDYPYPNSSMERVLKSVCNWVK